MKNWAQLKCAPCQKEVLPFDHAAAETNLKSLPGWHLNAGAGGIFREYLMKDFLSACRFIQEIAKIAESEDHHPDIHLTGYRKLRIDLSTHSIGGLSENDFILASKIDHLPKELKK